MTLALPAREGAGGSGRSPSTGRPPGRSRRRPTSAAACGAPTPSRFRPNNTATTREKPAATLACARPPEPGALTAPDPAPAARTRWRRNRSGADIRGPLVHQRPAPVEQVAAPVGRFHAVGVDVRKRELAHLARRVGALRRPIAERLERNPCGTAPMSSSRMSFGQGRLVQRAPARRRKHPAVGRRPARARRRGLRGRGARAAPDARVRPSCARRARSTPPRPGRSHPIGRCAPRPSARR